MPSRKLTSSCFASACAAVLSSTFDSAVRCCTKIGTEILYMEIAMGYGPLLVERKRAGTADYRSRGGAQAGPAPRRAYSRPAARNILRAMKNREHGDFFAVFVNAVNNDVWGLNEFACSLDKPGTTRVLQSRRAQAGDPIAQMSHDSCGRARTVSCDPLENSFEIPRGLLANDDSHTPSKRNRSSSSASVKVFASLSPMRLRTSAACSSVSRTGLLSCASRSVKISAASCCRCGDHV